MLEIDQAVSTAAGKYVTSPQISGNAPLVACHAPVAPAFLNIPVPPPSWKPTWAFMEAVLDAAKVASAQYVSVDGS